MPDPRPSRLPKVLLWISAGFLVLSMPCLLLGLLGFIGVVADAGPEENQSIGFGFLRIASIPLGMALLILIVALASRYARRS